MKVLLLGATGLVGSKTLDLLIQDDSITGIYILGRRSCGIENHKIIEFIGPLDEMKKHHGAFDVDACICCLGTTIKKAGSKEAFKKIDLDLPLMAAKECLITGVGTYTLVSALGASANSSVFYNSVKGKVEEEIDKLGLPQFYAVRPSVILGERNESRPLETVAIKGLRVLKPLFQGPMKKYAGSEVSEIAKILVTLSKGQRMRTSIEVLDYNP